MNELVKKQLSDMGISHEEVLNHQRRIKSVLAGETQTFLEVIDSCRLDNGGILPAKFCRAKEPAAGFVSFIPAAGAASRYFSPLTEFLLALETGDSVKVQIAREELLAKNLPMFALPAIVRDSLLETSQTCLKNNKSILAAIAEPKALQPANSLGQDFYEIKEIENDSLSAVERRFYVVPPGQISKFKDRHKRLGSEAEVDFIEQGHNLSTVRFDEKGEYYFEDGLLTAVPAGHGTLLKLMPTIAEKCERQHSLFIRNIDNIVGSSESAKAATNQFLEGHQKVLEFVRAIRQDIKKDNWTSANSVAGQLNDHIEVFDRDIKPYENFLKKSSFSDLWLQQIKLFNTQPDTVKKFYSSENEKELLKRLYQRPVNSLGQVPNLGHDVGGSAVVCRSPFGPFTICLEVPHANPEDQEKILKDPRVATHFNPVFVAAEIMDDISCYNTDDFPLWVLARKQRHGKSVLYHETVLYELLGNNLLANAMFPAVPRLLFNPRKKFIDAGQS